MLNPWLNPDAGPKVGDQVTISSGDIPLLDGIVEKVQADVTDPVVKLDLLDKIDALTRPISIPAWFSHVSTTSGLKYAGLYDLAIIDHVAALAGFYSTPRPKYGLIVAPLQGSAWMPERPQDLVKASESANDFHTALFDVTAWGRALAEGDIRVKPKSFQTGDLLLGAGFRIGVFTQDNTLYAPVDTAHVRLFWDKDTLTDWLGINVTPTRIQAAWSHSATGGVVCEIPRTGTAQHVQAVVSGAGEVTLTDGTVTATGSFTVPSLMHSEEIELCQIFATWLTPMLGGIYVDHATAPEIFIPTCNLHSNFDAGVESAEMNVYPAATTTALDVLKSHTAALGSAVWLDETGALQWWRPERLLSQTPAKVLTSEDNLLELAWVTDNSEKYAGVQVTYSQLAVERSWTYEPDATLWTATTAAVLREGEKQEIWIQPSSTEAWLFADTDWSSANNPANASALLWARGSFISGVIQEDGQPDTPADSVLYHSLESVGSGHKLTLEVSGLANPGSQSVVLRTPDDLPESVKARPLPILRGFNKASFQDVTASAGNVSGEFTGLPVLQRDLGVWVQSDTRAQAIASWWHDRVAAPLPRLSQVRIVPDHSVRLGQVVWLEDRVWAKVRLKVLVTRIEIRESSRNSSMSINCHVISAEAI